MMIMFINITVSSFVSYALAKGKVALQFSTARKCDSNEISLVCLAREEEGGKVDNLSGLSGNDVGVKLLRGRQAKQFIPLGGRC